MVTKGEMEGGREKSGVWDQQIQTTMYKIDKQQGPTIQYRELYSIPCNKLNGKGSENNIYIYFNKKYILQYKNLKIKRNFKKEIRWRKKKGEPCKLQVF